MMLKSVLIFALLTAMVPPHPAPLSLLAAALAAAAGCAGAPDDAAAPTTGVVFGTDDPSEAPLKGLTPAELNVFQEGDALFSLPRREHDGLGPLYIRVACASCHDEGSRGPGLAQRMAVVLADGFTAAPDQSKLAYGDTVRPLLAAGARTPVVPPDGDPSVKVSFRVGPPLLGHGYMEAVLDSEIERVAAEQAARADGIHGRINRVVFESQPNPDTRFHRYQHGQSNLIGRFGLKARVATLDDFVADALLRDIGITTPLRPTEMPNPDGLTDDLKPGLDATALHVNTIADYVRTLAIPRRPTPDPHGRALFDQVKCSVCHVPTLKTRPDYPIAALAGIDAPVYTDMLLHRWSDARGDGMAEGSAESRQWRTAPLIGLRFNKSYLHDGSAQTIEEAIAAHLGPGAEPSESVGLYLGLPEKDRQALLQFVSGL